MTLTRKRRYPQVARFYNWEGIARNLGFGRRWSSDPVKGKLDVMSHPRKVQEKIDIGNVGIGDCDDHAIYWATALLKNHLAQRVWIGTIWSQKPGAKKGSGHALCVFEDRRGDTYWADYVAPSRTIGQWGFARDYCLRTGAVILAAGLIEVTLRESGEPKLCKKVVRIVL
jgi:hypothetical protein